ncbi:hypothetical protein BC567DRAFT_1415 [Phyllosticta citribraziliensis]
MPATRPPAARPCTTSLPVRKPQSVRLSSRSRRQEPSTAPGNRSWAYPISLRAYRGICEEDRSFMQDERTYRAIPFSFSPDSSPNARALLSGPLGLGLETPAPNNLHCLMPCPNELDRVQQLGVVDNEQDHVCPQLAIRQPYSIKCRGPNSLPAPSRRTSEACLKSRIGQGFSGENQRSPPVTPARALFDAPRAGT